MTLEPSAATSAIGNPGYPPVGDLRAERVVSAAGLRSALDDVAGRDRAGEPVPVGARPSIPPGRRADDEGRVGHPRGDDDVRSRRQRGGDAPAAEVGVRGHRFDPARGQLGERTPGVQVREGLAGRPQRPDPVRQVVSGDMGGPRRQTEPGGDLGDLFGQARGVEAARVDDDADPPVQARAEHLFELDEERPRVARTGVPSPGLHRISIVSSAR